MNLYTIGFTQKSAQEFFELLSSHKVQRLVDIRINPHGQLSGFAKQEDLPYFLNKLGNNCQYIHMPELAPTKEILKDYRNDGDWPRYVTLFQELMDERNIPESLDRADFETVTCCLLCSEATPQQCHRRLVAERLASHWRNVKIIHL